jgi:pyruvate formate-lyase 1-activating enzyme
MGVLGHIHSVESFGTLDGPGIRYVLFLQGCALRCLYCHNPDTWECGGGKQIDSDDVISDILTYRNFIQTGGVTLSGGEPLLQAQFTQEILLKCKEHHIHTALDTAGSVPLSFSAPVLDAASLILLDIKSIDDAQCIVLTGKSNKETLLTLDYCEKTKKPVWIRHVLLPGYTLDFALLEKLADYLSGFTCIELVELLPFHKMGEFKWKSMGLPYTLGDTPEPKRNELLQVRQIFESRKLNCLLKDL